MIASENQRAASHEASGGIPISEASLSEVAGSHKPLVVLGVTGGIAAYKSPAIVRGLRAAGCDVRVVPTEASLQLVGKTTWEALSGHQALSEVAQEAHDVAHVRIGSEAHLLIIAPATANTLAKLAAGMADNMLTATALVATCPILVAPAMHTQMWEHPATQANVATLRERGLHFIGPEVGRLTGSDSGPGRMSEPEMIVSEALGLLASRKAATYSTALAGKSIAISAGGTHEPIDPVRYIGNRSTGRMGVAFANAAVASGAKSVTLVAANLQTAVLQDLDPRVCVEHVCTAAQLAEKMNRYAQSADVIVMSAAVADYRPIAAGAAKIKKSQGKPLTLELVENPDILANLVAQRRPGQLVVGFAAETGDSSHSALEYAQQKARRKGADFMIFNEVGATQGFGSVPTHVTLLDTEGTVLGSAQGSKAIVARKIWQLMSETKDQS